MFPLEKSIPSHEIVFNVTDLFLLRELQIDLLAQHASQPTEASHELVTL